MVSGFSGDVSKLVANHGCGGRTRTCGLRVMSCSEAPIPWNAWVSRLFYPRKLGETRRPTEFAPRLTRGLSRKWVGIWVSADSGNSRNVPLNQRRGFSPLYDPSSTYLPGSHCVYFSYGSLNIIIFLLPAFSLPKKNR